MFESTILTPATFLFSKDDRERASQDKFRGLLRWGPYQELPRAPKLGFVFPQSEREQANKLYRVLRNGTGSMFRGMETHFHVHLDREHVAAISDFQTERGINYAESAKVYTGAISRWLERGEARPDIFLILHPRTPDWCDDTPYHKSKALLLSAGILSQSVTFDLLENDQQLAWSAGNIALAVFAKLGGIPWVIKKRAERNQVVLGIGRSDRVDPNTRESKQTIAFTTCIRTDGTYRFGVFSRAASTRPEYLDGLRHAVEQAMERTLEGTALPEAITVHTPKEFGHDEHAVLRDVVEGRRDRHAAVAINVLKVQDEERFFALDSDDRDYASPRRGTCIAIDHDDYLMYTEGGDEKLSWNGRVPSALRIRHRLKSDAGIADELLSQVYDLSQMNWRGFNARSRPISILYSELIARILRHGDLERLEHSEFAQNSLWFL